MHTEKSRMRGGRLWWLAGFLLNIPFHFFAATVLSYIMKYNYIIFAFYVNDKLVLNLVRFIQHARC